MSRLYDEEEDYQNFEVDTESVELFDRNQMEGEVLRTGGAEERKMESERESKEVEVQAERKGSVWGCGLVHSRRIYGAAKNLQNFLVQVLFFFDHGRSE